MKRILGHIHGISLLWHDRGPSLPFDLLKYIIILFNLLNYDPWHLEQLPLINLSLSFDYLHLELTFLWLQLNLLYFLFFFITDNDLLSLLFATPNPSLEKLINFSSQVWIANYPQYYVHQSGCQKSDLMDLYNVIDSAGMVTSSSKLSRKRGFWRVSWNKKVEDWSEP